MHEENEHLMSRWPQGNSLNDVRQGIQARQKRTNEILVDFPQHGLDLLILVSRFLAARWSELIQRFIERVFQNLYRLLEFVHLVRTK